MKTWTSKKPNQELFRLLRFAIRFPGWHSYEPNLRKHIKRGEELGFFEVSDSKQFRLRQPDHNPLT